MVATAVRQVAKIKALADLAGIQTVAVLLPDENQINPALQKLVFPKPERYDVDLPQSLLIEEFAAADIEVLDLLPSFRTDPRCLYQNDSHWTAEGQELVAQRIHAAIAGRLLAGEAP